MVLPGRRHGTDGSVTCDHHYRWPEDVALMKRLGTDGHRFGVGARAPDPGPCPEPSASGDAAAQTRAPSSPLVGSRWLGWRRTSSVKPMRDTRTEATNHRVLWNGRAKTT